MIKKIALAMGVMVFPNVVWADGEQPSEDSQFFPQHEKIYRSVSQALLTNNNFLGIVPYEQNYLMETMSNGNYQFPQNMRHDEIKFQISLAVPIWKFNDELALAAAYTQQSYFQLTNHGNSSPFRESNYEPQIFLAWDTKAKKFWGDWQLDSVEFGVVHQSNGQSDDHNQSRSWNRIYATVGVSYGNFQIKWKPWWRIPESASKDDNRHIERYRGYGDLMFGYMTPTHQIQLNTHYNAKYGYGGVELSYSYPLTKYFRIYVQYYGGYGESLVDYNKNIQRVGLGFALNDIF